MLVRALLFDNFVVKKLICILMRRLIVFFIFLETFLVHECIGLFSSLLVFQILLLHLQTVLVGDGIVVKKPIFILLLFKNGFQNGNRVFLIHHASLIILIRRLFKRILTHHTINLIDIVILHLKLSSELF